MRKGFVVAFAGLALAGCGPAAEPAANAVAPEHPVNAASGGNDTAAVLAMPDAERRLVFARALFDAGIPCDGVIKAERAPDQQGLPVWRADCKNGTSHAVSITPDGTANILSRPR